MIFLFTTNPEVKQTVLRFPFKESLKYFLEDTSSLLKSIFSLYSFLLFTTILLQPIKSKEVLFLNKLICFSIFSGNHSSSESKKAIYLPRAFLIPKFLAA